MWRFQLLDNNLLKERTTPGVWNNKLLGTILISQVLCDLF